MRQAEKNISPNWGAEKFTKTNNCQSYIREVKKEYNRLKKNMPRVLWIHGSPVIN